MRVLKWHVPIDDRWHSVGGGEPVLVGQQGDPATAVVWTRERDENDPMKAFEEAHRLPRRQRVARVYGTGATCPSVCEHLGSFQTPEGLVWHVVGTWADA